MDLPNHNFGFFAGKNHIQEAGGSFLGESTVFSAFHVKAFNFELVDIFAVDFKHVDSGIFLFGVEEQSAEDIVDVDFQELVSFVD